MPATPLVNKLGIKPGQRLLILQAPEGYLQKLDPLPENTELQTNTAGKFDFIQIFAHKREDVERLTPEALQALKPRGQLWFAYPKLSSKVKTDLTRDHGWDSLVEAGWRVVTLISIDDTWSALRFRPLEEVKTKKQV